MLFMNILKCIVDLIIATKKLVLTYFLQSKHRPKLYGEGFLFNSFLTLTTEYIVFSNNNKSLKKGMISGITCRCWKRCR